jgi:molecular chaperone GrpE (heat shock protein)
MENETSAQVMSIGIVGGGKAGLQLLELFSKASQVKIAFIVDRDQKAPAMQTARERGIPIYDNFEKAIASIKTDVIFELTGSMAVCNKLKQAVGNTGIELVTHKTMAQILTSIDDANQEIRTVVSQDIRAIRDDISSSLDSISKLMENVEEITADMRILGLNARIEAARAGEAGKGFEVVAQQMTSSVDAVRNIVQEMMEVNAKIKAIASNVDDSLEKLK